MSNSQLIFVVETNEQCKSDWIYIKETIKNYYTLDNASVKLTTTYMRGKNHYNSVRVINEIKCKIAQYNNGNKNGKSIVIYCFDCDQYDKQIQHKKFLEEVKIYCKINGYEFVWFCRDIEMVYIGKSITDRDKKRVANQFMMKSTIKSVPTKNLEVEMYRNNTSNILKVLDKYLNDNRKPKIS